MKVSSLRLDPDVLVAVVANGIGGFVEGLERGVGIAGDDDFGAGVIEEEGAEVTAKAANGLLFAVDEDCVAVGGNVHGDDLAALDGCGVAIASAGFGAAFGGGTAFAIALATGFLHAVTLAGAWLFSVVSAGLFHAVFVIASAGLLGPAVAFSLAVFLHAAFTLTFTFADRSVRITSGLFDGFAFTDFGGDFFFNGAGGGEGITNENAKREDEQCVEPGLAGGWVCDHENALAQGGVAAHTWSQPCNGRGCAKRLLILNQIG